MTEINIYRVRKSFDDIKSQRGAYLLFEAAVKSAQKYKLNVYNNDGRLLYKYKKRRTEVLRQFSIYIPRFKYAAKVTHKR